MIFAARILGPEDFGRFSFAWSVIHILLVGGTLGLDNTALRKVAAEPDRSQSITQTYFLMRGILSLLQLGTVLVIAAVVRETPETRAMLVIFGIGLAFHSLSFSMNVIFQAHGKLYLASINTFLVFGGHGIIGLIILFAGGQLVALSSAYLIAAILGALLNFRLFPKIIHPYRLGRHEDWKEFLQQSVPVGLGSMFQAVAGRIAITLLLLLAGPLETGVFSAASRIPMVLRNFPRALLAAFIPVMASHQGEPTPVRILFAKSFAVMMALALPPTVFFYALAEPVTLILFGQDYLDSIAILRILSWSIVPMFAGLSISHVVLSQNHLIKRIPWVTGVGLVVAITTSLVLIPSYGTVGAAYSVLLTQVAAAAGYFLAARTFLFSRRGRQ
jgi:O-antigen/teichoic acid export membrane protein